MPGKRQFAAGRENAQARRMCRIFRGEHEHRLGKIELPRNRLHRRVRKAIAVEDHGERVARQLAVGENIVDRVESFQNSLPASLPAAICTAAI